MNTADPNIVKSLLWGSILSLLIKRFVAFHVGLMFDEYEGKMIENIFKFLSRWAARVHPARDSNTTLFQLGKKLFSKQ